MKKCSCLFFFIFSSLFADDSYLKLLNQFPESLGRHASWQQGEIEIASSPTEIKKIEQHARQKLLRLGYTDADAKAFSKIGIIHEDRYWMWVRDAVIFPGGVLGTYNRIVPKSALTGPASVVIFPVLPNKKIVVNITFRHATRSWEMELPRGGRQEKESAEQAALRELKEETGYTASKFISLGYLTPNSGVIGGTIPVFFGEVREKTARHQDEGEAIAKNVDLTVDEVRDAFIKGYLIIDIQGTKTKVHCRDPFLSFAILQALWRKLI